MCGIAGVLMLRPGPPPDAAAMATAVTHRGPDASGRWTDELCALGHQRLAIIDLSDAGCQPMTNDDESTVVVYNGEIYNFAELRDELQRFGYRFRSRTDTEVLVHGYAQWGEDVVTHLRGMFAFALWDRHKRALLLARDRAGKKPLFYANLGDRLVFASEIQGVLAHPGVSREADPTALVDYLTWGYVPAPATGFQAIRKIPPAHTAVIHPGDTTISTQGYWQLPYTPKLRTSPGETDEQLRALLTEAVRIRLVSDVPLGAFLSGGIDSSIVVGLMAQLSSKPVKTFSIGFHEAGFDELPHARRVAERWGTEHTEMVVRPDALAVLATLVRHYGEPYADSSAIPTYYVSQMTRQHVTVALNGDGGDESFAGYQRYWANRMAARLPLHAGAAAWAARLASALPNGALGSTAGKAARYMEAAALPMPARYARWSSYFPPPLRARLMGPALTAAAGDHRPEAWMESLFDRAGNLGPVDAAMHVDVHSYLPYDLLVKVDIASMANSLEARSPFLDHHVMEFAARLPEHEKLRGHRGKAVLRRAFREMLPMENVQRPKMGFAVPVGEWLRGPLRPLLEDTLLNSAAAVNGYLDSAVINELARRHLSRQADHTPQLWSLLMLECWHREMGATAPWGRP